MRNRLGTLAALGLTLTSAIHAAPPPAPPAPSSAASSGASLYDINGRLVGALPGSAPATGLRAITFHKSRIVSQGSGFVELPAGVYFEGSPLGATPLAAPGPAAFGFADITEGFLPAATWNPSDFQAGDINRDGRMDLAFSINRDGCETTPALPFRVWIQQSDGTFADETVPRVPMFVRMGQSLELIDIERDGDLDVLLAGYSCTGHHVSAALFINDGTGHFSNQSAARLPQFGDDRFVYLMTQGLLNDDPFPDLAATIFGQAVLDSASLNGIAPEVWLNNGTGRLVRAAGHVPIPAFGYMGVSASDFTGDGRTDIAWANSQFVATDQQGQPIDTLSGQTALFRNIGGGRFVDETSSRIPAGFERSQAWLPLADVDGDGDRDLLEVGFPSPENTPQLRLLVNDGSGRFTLGEKRGLDGITGYFNRPRFGRLSGWLGMDLFLPTVDPAAGGDAPDKLLVNNGAGVFGDFSSVLPPVSDFSVGCALFDYESDGDIDIATGNAAADFPGVGQNRLYRNRITPVAVDPEAAQGIAGLGPAYPNPATSGMAARLSLARKAHARVLILDTGGRLVRELTSRRLDAGGHVISWDLRDAAGRRVGAGVYTLRFETEETSLARRFVVTR